MTGGQNFCSDTQKMQRNAKGLLTEITNLRKKIKGKNAAWRYMGLPKKPIIAFEDS